MKVFTHGSIVNFQESAREMFLADLEQLIVNYQEENKRMLFGTIDINKEELHVFGVMQQVHLNDKDNVCDWHFSLMDGEEKTISHPLDSLQISHDAMFDLLDDAEQQVRYQVIYLTFNEDEDGQEVSYFLAKEGIVSDPLSCVVEFWQHVWEVGKDVDFTISGCRTKVFCQQ